MTLLWPKPKRLERRGDAFRLPGRLRVAMGEGVPEAAVEGLARIRPVVRQDEGAAAEVRLRIVPGGAPESYRLTVGEGGAEVEGADAAGVFYGAATLCQWLRLGASEGQIPGVEITDAPDLRHRGVMLDVSRDKVPTLETLFELVERLASWKVNQLQLYTEHTFAYRGHEVVWQGASPLTPDDVRLLDRHCRERCVELVPNQNSFGHLHRWLRHDAYRPLAEVPEGVEHAFGDRREPFSLCPVDPRSLELLEDLYAQLLPNFESRQCNVGCDETFDLGRGRSAEACERLGKGRVYLDFLLEVRSRLERHGRRMQFWGDILLEHPELIGELPEDVIPLAWGYEADHPFEAEAARFAARGGEFYLCPGTSSWISLAGRVRNALGNLAAATRAAREHGAAGLLICDWGDFGHLQPLPASLPGLLAGAGFAWNAEAAEDPEEVERQLPALLDAHAFAASRAAANAPGTSFGRALVELGNAYLHAGARPKNGSALFHLLLFAHQGLDHRRFEGMSAATLAVAEDLLQQAAAAIPPAETPGADLASRELHWVADTLRFACRLGRHRFEKGGERSTADLPEPLRRRLRPQLQELIERHRGLWLARNRPGGLDDSCHWLARVVALLA